MKVVLLEKNRIASGDTAFTTGFLLRIPDTSIARLEERYGTEFVKRVFEGAAKAQESIRKTIREKKIDCGFSDCNAYYCSYSSKDKVLAEEWKALSGIDERASFARGKEVSALGPDIKEAIVFKGEGQFNPRKFIFGLLSLPEAKNITVFEESEVLDVEVGETILARTQGGGVRAKKIVVTSGWPIEAFSELRAMFEPKITYAIAAEFDKAPISPDLFWDTYDPYFYYRRLDDKTIILGGADRRPGDKPKPGEPEAHEKLESFLRDHIGGRFRVTNAWSGTLYESPDGLPFASEHPHYRGKVFIGACCGFGGNGLLLGSFAGSVVADLVAGKKTPYADILSFSRAKIEIPRPQPKVKKPEGPKSRIFIKIADAGDVSEGEPHCAVAGGTKIALFRTKEGYFAVSNTCTHAGGSLCDGAIDGDTVTCPLHGAKFDIRSGKAVGPPATKPLETYKTRVTGNSVEVEIETEVLPKAPVSAKAQAVPGPKMFEGAMRDWKFVLGFILLSLMFWGLQFAYQYFVLIPGELQGALVRSFALSGATYFGFALFSSIVFKFRPPLGQYWYIRRAFGVMGFAFIFFHVFTVIRFFFGGDPSGAFYSLNPFENPIVFGALAYPVFFVMFLTSTDWAVGKLGAARWKIVHRLVYFGYLFSVFHFILINPELLMNPAGYLLLAITALTLGGELFWWFKTVSKRNFSSLGTYIGILVIALYLLFSYFAFLAPYLIQQEDLAKDIESMKEFMEENGGDPGVMLSPVPEDQGFSGSIVKSGDFQNLNYMTAGGASIVESGGSYFVMFDDSFDTPNGPDLVVYLTKNGGPSSREDIMRGIELGELKSIKGKQVYEIPKGTQLSEYNSVTIQCRAFNVPWSYAPFRS
jgi:glycine/D-amino acid oxidase-like deaminating enzyme/nitrite reductase/ring-hydroxylating ferredoxin subunit/DMSO/TMAO reductase YedYZ heme-binding membrane subunit